MDLSVRSDLRSDLQLLGAIYSNEGRALT
jgi:hypothetical protein